MRRAKARRRGREAGKAKEVGDDRGSRLAPVPLRGAEAPPEYDLLVVGLSTRQSAGLIRRLTKLTSKREARCHKPRSRGPEKLPRDVKKTFSCRFDKNNFVPCLKKDKFVVAKISLQATTFFLTI